MSSSNCCFLTCIQISQEAGQVVWYSSLFKNFPVCCDPHSQAFSVVNKAKVDFFFFSGTLLFDDPADIGNLSLVPLRFLNPAWTFFVHVLLKPGLENFEHYFAGIWDKCNCALVWTFFGIAFLWDWNETDLFQSCGHCWDFQICWHICWHIAKFAGTSSRIWNTSTGIPSPPLALFVVMLHKAHLTLHYGMSGSKWLITPSWLSDSWRSFLYRLSLFSCHHFLISSTSVRSIPSLHEMFLWYL